MLGQLVVGDSRNMDEQVSRDIVGGGHEPTIARVVLVVQPLHCLDIKRTEVCLAR